MNKVKLTPAQNRLLERVRKEGLIRSVYYVGSRLELSGREISNLNKMVTLGVLKVDRPAWNVTEWKESGYGDFHAMR